MIGRQYIKKQIIWPNKNNNITNDLKSQTYKMGLSNNTK